MAKDIGKTYVLRALITAILAVVSLTAWAQEDETPEQMPSATGISITSSPDVLLVQHWAMPTLTNPASTGDVDYIRIRGGARLDWLGSRQSPKNFLAAADSPFKLAGKRIGAGVIVNSQSYDVFRNLLVGAQGSYKLQFKKTTLSIGVQIGYYHTKFKGSELRLSDMTGGGAGEDSEGEDSDPEEGEDSMPAGGKYEDFPTNDVAGGALDLSFGVRFEHPKFYVGISGLHLNNPTVKLSTEGESSTDSRYIKSKLPLTLYFDAGGNIPIHNSLFTLQPSMILASDFSDITGIAEMRATYNKLVTFGLDYRYNRAFGVVAGLSLKNFYIGYSWEYDYKNHPEYSTGNHEIVIGYQFKMDMGGKNTFSHRSIRIM